jgi:hypothetical protein
MEQYFESARRMNRRQWSRLRWLYDSVATCLGNALGADVFYAPAVALPGFHIFDFRYTEKFFGGSPHFDLQFLELPWVRDKSADYAGSNVSFTLALELPQAACGVDVWRLAYQEVANADVVELPCDVSQLREKTRIEYRLGEISVFDGFYWHQISEIQTLQPTDRRITLQGHCFYDEPYWVCYW